MLLSNRLFLPQLQLQTSKENSHSLVSLDILSHPFTSLLIKCTVRDSVYLQSLRVLSHSFTTSNLVMPYWHLKNTNLLCDWSFIINIVQWHNLCLPIILIYQSCLSLLWCCFFLFILIMIKQSHSPPSCFEMIIIRVGIKLIILWLNAIKFLILVSHQKPKKNSWWYVTYQIFWFVQQCSFGVSYQPEI